MNYTSSEIAKMIDHALLNPALITNQLEEGIQIAISYDVASVCILPYYLKRCAQLLQGSTIKASTTIGFPHGATTTAAKLAEAKQALDDGGQELDVVVNISQVVSGKWEAVVDDLQAVIEFTHARRQKV
ncbi:MAG TPA: deoxyribose-phosphate aldolase, partial [Acidobacteriota bacterium]|nr:deoxyribose-phosphate aldolase [Acidobacteriota bacterium]